MAINLLPSRGVRDTRMHARLKRNGTETGTGRRYVEAVSEDLSNCR
jgi:hypothetical protein